MLSYPQASAVDSLLAKRSCTQRRILRYTKHRLRTSKAKRSTQGKPGVSMRVIQTPSRVRLGLCLPLCSSARTTLLFLLVYYLLPYVLCGNSLPQIQRPGPLSLSTSLAARVWCPHRCKPASVSGREPKPTPRRH